MSDRTSAARLHISTEPPFPISKDVQGSDNPIPLSPQWLLPKPGENKPGTGTVENHVFSTPSYGNPSETGKTSGIGEDVQDGHKRKDVFRPSVLDSENGRRDRWRDEERDTKPSIRKDRWRDGDKDLSDARKVDRWAENQSARQFGETQRGTPDRWNDSGNRDMNYDQRRESKWNTRWGPDDKELEAHREKWNDSGKNGDQHMDKGLSHISNLSKDEKEGDHYRPWRSNSSQSRGRVEPPHNQNATPNKQGPAFYSGRGRGEDTPPAVTPGRPRLGSGVSPINSTFMHSQYPGTALDKVESEHGEACPFRYSRTNMLDVYRVTDVRTDRKLVDDFLQVPPLTQDELLEPLALCKPNHEELCVLKGIDIGEIMSSSAPPGPKDGRNSTEFPHSRRMKLGNASAQDRGEDGGSYKVAEEVPSNRESTFEENNSVHPRAAWRATPLGEHTSNPMHDGRDVLGDVRPRNLDMSWSHQPKDPRTQWDNNLDYLSDTKEAAKWQSSEQSFVKRQLSGILDSEHETGRDPQTSAEELSLFYRDPQGRVQGPFKGIDIIGWLEAGYFGIDLPVRLESSAPDSPWLQLCDAMPHLRAKGGPPPGFSSTKVDSTEAPGWQNSSIFGNVHSGLNEAGMLRNDSMNRQSSGTEAENRFLESLMSGSKSNPLTISEGLQGFITNNSGNMGPSGVDGGSDPYLLAKRLALERQRSLPNPYPYWPGIDAPSLTPKSDMAPDSSAHSKLLSSLSENSRQFPSQNSELISIIQGLSDRASTGLNNGVPGWTNYPLQGGLNPFQNKIDLHHDQNFLQMPFGIHQQRLQTPNQLPLNNFIAQTADPSSILAAEKLRSSSLSQDPQMLNMLQQQYLLQLHSQATAPTQQMPMLDQLLLLKQQQQQEEQQLLLRQQQQLLSQVLQDHQSHQHLGNLSYGQLQGGGIPGGNLHGNSSQFQPPHQNFPMSSQTPIHHVHDELSNGSLISPLQVSQDTRYNISSESSVQLPQQLFENHQINWGLSIPEHVNEKYQGILPASASVESSLLHEQNRTKEEPDIVQKPPSVSDCYTKSAEQMPDKNCTSGSTLVNTVSESGGHSQSVQCVEPVVAVSTAEYCEIQLPLASHLGQDVRINSDKIEEEPQAGRDSSNVEPPVVDVRNVEALVPKKANEKKSRKQKSSKSQSSDQTKEELLKSVTLQQSKKLEAENPNYSESNLKEVGKVEAAYHQEVGGLPANISQSITETVIESDSKAGSSFATQNNELPSGRAWKPAPGFKAKSLLEIQQEEQKKAQTDMLVAEVTNSVNSLSLTTPWVGVVANPDSAKVSVGSYREADTEYLAKPETSKDSKNKKSQLHDLLAEDVKKSSERDGEVPDTVYSSQYIAVHSEPIDDGDFIEAKDSKRSRKRSSKAKGSGSKVSLQVASTKVPISSSPIEKGKSSRVLLQEKEQLPAIPSGPSLGDFVIWKGESTSPSPSPAWSTDSAKISKPLSLRDILKEQEKKSSSAAPPSQVPTPQKLQPAQAARSSAPSKAAPSGQINSQSSQSKHKGDDDLFWGPIEQSKQETKQSDFPQLASQGSWGSKNVPVKGNSPGPLSRQKSGSTKPTEQSQSSSAAMTKNSEAMDFRVWCENECARLIGTKDTSFLEFCLKQSRSEAEMFLIENLGTYDPDHEFIEKFLNYMELLPSDVLEIAFQAQNGFEVAGGVLSGNANLRDMGQSEGSSLKAAGKKGKKGKKVSAAVLGFNVVSNRIMMGEIQTVED